jgi:methionyl-tRNA formyltransferase
MRAWYGAEVCSALAAPDVREVCAAMRIPLKQIRGFWDADARQLFADLAPDLGVSIGNGLMPPEFFGIPRLGMINVHHEILPQYRGAQTAIWQIHDGSRETGFSIHNVDSRIDSGRILLRESMPIKFGRTLHETIVTTCTFVQRRSAEQLLRVVSDIERYRHEAIPNEGGTLYSTPSTTALMRIYRNHARLRTPRA